MTTDASSTDRPPFEGGALHFGVCPTCHRHDDYFNVGRSHWFRCDEHKTVWCAGSNLFSSWHDETEETWAENERRYADYAQVVPYYGEEDVEEAGDIPVAVNLRETEADKRANELLTVLRDSAEAWRVRYFPYESKALGALEIAAVCRRLAAEWYARAPHDDMPF